LEMPSLAISSPGHVNVRWIRNGSRYGFSRTKAS
jgi:hypothetical protein